MSWGLMQVMGRWRANSDSTTPRWPNSAIPPPESNSDAASWPTRLARTKGDVPAALLAWNGGGRASPNYAAEVLARKRNYSSRPT